MLRFRLGLIAALAAALLAACSPAAPPAPSPQAEPPTAAPGSYPAPTTQGAYPAPTTQGAYPAPAQGAYPGPAGAAPTEEIVDTGPLVVPQPSSQDVGNATGTLIRINDDGTRTPINRGILYLGRILTSEGGVAGMVELDKATAPSAVTNSRGEFVFTDVPPGRYGLMIDLVEGAVLLNDPDTGGDMIVEITGGQILELGEMAYDLPGN